MTSSSELEFPHHMIKEIYEQPRAIEETMNKEIDQVRKIAEIIDQYELIYITGSGTSYHAGLAGALPLSLLTRPMYSVIPASEFGVWIPQAMTRRASLIAISQSGESVDVLEAVKAASERRMTVIAITNSPGSPLTKLADYTLLTHAGKEFAVAATKTYTAQLSTLYMLSLELAELQGINRESVEGLRGTLLGIPNLVNETLAINDQQVKELAYDFKHSNYFFLLGSGANYPTALEGALKLKEACNIFAEGFAAREFLHGPIQLISGGIPIIFIAIGEDVARLMSLMQSITNFGAPLISISDRPGDLLVMSREVIQIPEGCPNIFSPILSIIPLQLFAYYSSRARGLNPDRPERLRKVVK